MKPIEIIVGFDQREAIAYHVFCQSVLEKASIPVRFLPLSNHTLSEFKETHRDGSNAFTYTRFLCPYLMNYEGWVIFADGDMVCRVDIAELWNLRDATKAVQVVQHDYSTKSHKKYLGNTNENYPRKNWSSVILWNCSHPDNRQLTPEFVSNQSGAFLHRFQWLKDSSIGAIPMAWNWLAIEYEASNAAKIIHYTLGTPCFKDYKDTSMSGDWYDALVRTIQGLDS